MHTVRNRKASRPPVACMSKIPAPRSARAPAFPADLVLPPRRGAVITAAAWPAMALPGIDAGDVLVSTAPPAQKPLPRGKRAKRRARKAGRAGLRANHVPALALPPAPEPLVEPLARVAQPPAAEPVVSPPCDDPRDPRDPAAPLPRARSLVPARRQGLVDIVAYILRDSGRRLARWSARRHQTRENRAEMARAERERASLQLQLEALTALREFARAE